MLGVHRVHRVHRFGLFPPISAFAPLVVSIAATVLILFFEKQAGPSQVEAFENEKGKCTLFASSVLSRYFE